LRIAYGSFLASLIASSIIIEEAVAVAQIEIKSITAHDGENGIFIRSHMNGYTYLDVPDHYERKS
jgi:hypothetical protein